MDSHVSSLQPFISYCPSYPTVPFRIGRTVQWISMCPPYNHSHVGYVGLSNGFPCVLPTTIHILQSILCRICRTIECPNSLSNSVVERMWIKDGVPIDSSDETIPSTGPGIYICTLSNMCGSDSATSVINGITYIITY